LNVSLLYQKMKKTLFILFVTVCFSLLTTGVFAQCSICAKTVAQMGSRPAEGFNTGILYLMFIPYVAIGVVGYKWWQNEKRKAGDEAEQNT
jgi:hypothetical protein